MFQKFKLRRKLYINYAIGLLQILIGGFCSFTFGFGFIGCIGNMIMYKRVGIGATFIFLILFILFAFMLNRGLKRRRLNRIYFTCAQNPSLTVDQLAIVLKMPLKSLKRDLDTIVKRGLIPEMPTLEPDTKPDMKSVNEPKLDEYVEVNCRNCGASIRILKGSAKNCEYCGSLLSTSK